MRISISRTLPILMGITAGLAMAGVDYSVGLRLRLGDFFFLMALPLILVAYMRGQPRNDLVPVVLSFALYIAYVVLNGAVTSGLGTAIKEGVQLSLFYLCVLFGYVVATRDDESFRRFARVFLFMLWVVVLYGVYWHVSRGITSGWKELGEQKLAFGMLVAAMVGLKHPAIMSSRRHLLLLLLALLLVLLSGERKGWLAAMMSCLAMMTVSEKGLSKKSVQRLFLFSIGVTLLIGFAITIAPALPYLNRQMASIGEFVGGLFEGEDLSTSTASNQARVFILNFGYNLFLENPIFGSGLESFKDLMRLIPGNDIVHGAHNELLRIAAELGVVGLVLYLNIYVMTYLRFRQVSRIMARLSSMEVLRLWLGIGLLVYGFMVNLFLVNGGPSIFVLVFPVALIHSVPIHGRIEAPGVQPAPAMMGAVGSQP